MTNRRVRIAHFGDLHLEELDDEFLWVLHMAAVARAEGADHLLFTGDVVDVGRVDLIRELFARLTRSGFGAGSVSFVPGNHDIYPLGWPPTPGAVVGAICALLGHSQHNWEELGALSHRVHAQKNAGRVLGEDGFPWVRQLTADVALIGLDTTRSELKDPRTWAEGELDDDDLDRLEWAAMRVRGKHRVAVMHHYPFDDFQPASNYFPMTFASPRARDVRIRLTRAGITAVLCGHIHENRDRRSKDGLRVLTTDSSLYDLDDGRTGRTFRIVTFGPGVRVTTRLIDVDEA